MSRKKTISRLIKIRDSIKTEIQMQVKAASDRAEDEHSELISLEMEYNNAVDAFNRRSLEGTMDIKSVNEYYEYIEQVNSGIVVQRSRYKEALQELETLKERLVEAHRDKKSFEILHDRIDQQQRREALVAEQKETDFIAITRMAK